MTEIANRLGTLLKPNSITAWLSAYGYAGLISCGPWVISISALAITNTLIRDILPIEQRDLFSTTTTYAYALSLILTGPLQLIVARYAGNLIANGKSGGLFSSAIAALTLAGVVAMLGAALVFGWYTSGSLVYKFASVSLTVQVAMVIVSVVFLGALRKFHLILTAFALGYAVGSIGAVAVAPRFGVPGIIGAFTLGHLVIMSILLIGLARESKVGFPSWGFMALLVKIPALALTGLFYNLGIWSDKFLFWWLSNHSISVDGILRASPNYDVAIYLSLLSIIPGFATMFFFMETDFTKSFLHFFDQVDRGGALSQLEDAKLKLMKSIQEGLKQLITVQGITTVSLLLCAARLAERLGIGALQQGVFSVTIIGTCLLLIFLFVLTILFYLNDIKGSLISTAVFFSTNTTLSYFTLRTDEAWHGYGFLAASSIACLTAMVFANRACGSLEYRSFRKGSSDS